MRCHISHDRVTLWTSAGPRFCMFLSNGLVKEKGKAWPCVCVWNLTISHISGTFHHRSEVAYVFLPASCLRLTPMRFTQKLQCLQTHQNPVRLQDQIRCKVIKRQPIKSTVCLPCKIESRLFWVCKLIYFLKVQHHARKPTAKFQKFVLFKLNWHACVLSKKTYRAFKIYILPDACSLGIEKHTPLIFILFAKKQKQTKNSLQSTISIKIKYINDKID